MNPIDILTQHLANKTLSHGFSLRLQATPRRFSEQAYFSLFLTKGTSQTRSNDFIFKGIFSLGRPRSHIHGWVDGDFYEKVFFSDGTIISLASDSRDVEFFRILGGLVPAGGSLMVSYSPYLGGSEVHEETRRGLDRGYPPAVTPLGSLLFWGGCGMGFKDWYFAEGGNEGPEKLQGFKPIDSESMRGRATIMLEELEQFRRTPHEIKDDLLRGCLVRAERVIEELKSVI